MDDYQDQATWFEIERRAPGETWWYPFMAEGDPGFDSREEAVQRAAELSAMPSTTGEFRAVRRRGLA